MNIVLIGLRGSGKSALGKLVAEKLLWDFVDIDETIEKDTKSSIPAIVKNHGWEHFRELEKQATEKVSKLRNTVIATGGGTVLDEENVTNLRKTGSTIYLSVAPEACFERIKNSSKRPPLTSEENLQKEMEKLFNERDVIYKKAANHILIRSNDLEKDAEKILKIISKF